MTWNPMRLANMLRQIAHWNSRAILNKKTKLNCQIHGLQVVTEFRPLERKAILACQCHRSVELDLTAEDRESLNTYLLSPEGRKSQRVVRANATSVTYADQKLEAA